MRENHHFKERLRKFAWAKDLTPIQMERVEKVAVARLVLKGEFVCRTGEMLDGWIGVIDGALMMKKMSPDGKSTSLSILHPGTWFGEGTLLKQEKLQYDVAALSISLVARIPADTFNWLVDTSPPFTRFLLMQINDRLGQFAEMLEGGRLLSAESRIARCLLTLFNAGLSSGTGSLLAISQEEISCLAGMSRQRANQALQMLKEAGLLQVDYGGIRILDLESLGEFAAREIGEGL